MEHPLVSVPVITYNSSKTVLETLESIKAQTYPNIELLISDDCSMDNTVEICQEWIEQNKLRFARTEILTIEENKGTSANFNRAEAACRGEWIKPIAGDDLLMPNCVDDCVHYITNHPDVKVLFGRVRAFGGAQEENEEMDSRFCYELFHMSSEQMLHHLLFHTNGIPAPGFFYHRALLDEYHIKNDERIPLIEDYPKWINILRAGITFHFLDKDIVKYRIGNGISTRKRSSLKYFESERLLRFYYIYPAWLQENSDIAVKRIVQEERDLYKQLLEAENEDTGAIHRQRNEYKVMYDRSNKQYMQIASSKAYKLGKILLKPFSLIKEYYFKIKCHH